MSAAFSAATPRLAATVLLVRDDPFEVLMVRRATRAIDAFSAALVFPGGVVDPEDHDPAWTDLIADGTLDDKERALRVAACRETFEEAGILLADRPLPLCPRPGPDFAATVRAAGVRLAVDGLVHFGHWITPAVAPRRFDTHFYLGRMPDDAVAVCDGRETVALQWVSPASLCDGKGVPFPTRMNLRRLAESADAERALAAARARPRFTVLPVASRRDGAVVVTIPAEAGYGVTEDIRGGGPG